MVDALADGITYAGLGIAAWSLVLIVLNRTTVPDRRDSRVYLGVLVLFEVALLVQTVIGVVGLFGDRELDRAAFVGYLVVAIVIMPVAWLWSVAERSRWGPGVLTVGSLAVLVIIVRLQQIWTEHG